MPGRPGKAQVACLAAFRGHDTLSSELRARLGGHQQSGDGMPMTYFTESFCDSGPRAHRKGGMWGWDAGSIRVTSADCSGLVALLLWADLRVT